MATILVVDDEKLIRELCHKALQDYNVLLAGNVDDAFRIYEQETVDVILTDIMMPGDSGFELLKKVKELDPNAAVIIMTAFSEKEVILSALKEGADDFIHKPLNLLMLKTSVSKALYRKALKEEVANLKKLDKLKSNFLSLISHKFRTPITSISLFLQNAKYGVYNTNDSSFDEAVSMILDESSYLARMVDDLLMFSYVMGNSEVLELTQCDLNVQITNALMLVKKTWGSSDIEVDFTAHPFPLLQLDQKKISFALQQIIDNAFKFSGSIGHISISLYSDENRVYIAVSDTGIGMPASELPKVFEKFYQIDPDNTGQVRGFGLGLFYAREFVRLHGGGISIDSQPGLGTTVTITLPRQISSLKEI